MENKFPGKSFLPLTIVFIVTSLFFLIGRSWLEAHWSMDYLVLLVGNLILYLATSVSFLLYIKALRDSNPHVFLRMLYASLLIKMMFSLAATLLYLFLAGKDANKAGIIGCYVLYVIYTYVEVKVLMRLSKKLPKNV